MKALRMAPRQSISTRRTLERRYYYFLLGYIRHKVVLLISLILGYLHHYPTLSYGVRMSVRTHACICVSVDVACSAPQNTRSSTCFWGCF
jgi:hypothetical protein